LWASKLSEEEKGGIVGEGERVGVREMRRGLEGRIERLEGARRVCGGGGDERRGGLLWRYEMFEIRDV